MAWEGSHSQGFPPWMRAFILQRDPACRCSGCKHCTPEGCTKRSTIADHVIPKAEHGADTPTNGQGLCDPCHQPKIQAEAARGRARNSPKRPSEAHPGLL